MKSFVFILTPAILLMLKPGPNFQFYLLILISWKEKKRFQLLHRLQAATLTDRSIQPQAISNIPNLMIELLSSIMRGSLDGFLSLTIQKDVLGQDLIETIKHNNDLTMYRDYNNPIWSCTCVCSEIWQTDRQTGSPGTDLGSSLTWPEPAERTESWSQGWPSFTCWVFPTAECTTAKLVEK